MARSSSALCFIAAAAAAAAAAEAAASSSPSISPSCMMNGNPCPLPVGWAVDWSLANSTSAMPEAGGAGVNGSGFWPAPGHHWGAVSLDWQVGEPA